MGTKITEGEELQLLRLIRVKILDVDKGGDHEHEAKNLLRQAVLQRVAQVDLAWNTIVAACAEYAVGRSGADRPILQQRLLAEGVALKAPRSYREDIERLQVVSQSTLAVLSDHSKIQVGPIEVKISRPSTAALRSAAESGSLVVIGEPGAGKSGALHDFVESINGEQQAERHDVVFLAVDRFEARSLGLLRDELGLKHELSEILENWPGKGPGFLVIDALDAARSDASARTFRELLSDVLQKQGRWQAVTSIRKFDLRYSVQLQRLFSGVPPTEFCDKSEFSQIRHINILRLSDEELSQIQSPELRGLVERAEENLRDLLRIVFNLYLMAELLDAGVATDSLVPIRTQIELLDKYWLERVIRDDMQGDERERILRRAAERMVETRSLRVNRSEITPDSFSGPALIEVLKAQVLVEWQPVGNGQPDRYSIAFAHHVLFDYAVARLLLRRSPDGLIDRLEHDPDLVLAIRPSIVLHFQYHWFSGDPARTSFWNLVLPMVQNKMIPEVGKIIGPVIAAELITQILDYAPLLAALEETKQDARDVGERVLRHIVSSLLASSPNSLQPLMGAGLWCELLERISQLKHLPVEPIRILLSAVCEKPGLFTEEQRLYAGKAARRFLEFTWQQSSRQLRLIIYALQGVCRTFESDPIASATLCASGKAA